MSGRQVPASDAIMMRLAGIIRDFRADGTLANGSRDVEPPHCMRAWVAIDWRDGVSSFRPFGGPMTLVTRRRDSGSLWLKYPGRGERRLERICRLPEQARGEAVQT